MLKTIDSQIKHWYRFASIGNQAKYNSIKYYFMDYYKCKTLFLVIELSESVVRAASTMWVEAEVVLHVTYALG